MYKRSNQLIIKIGEPLVQSVYSENGDLLLKKGRIITTERQKMILINLGFCLQSECENIPESRPKSLSASRNKSENQEDIFDIKSRWLEELFRVFNLAKQTQVANFSYRVIRLATEIQRISECQQDALLAAFQLDHENHYGLVHALHCAVICETIAKSIGLSRIDRLGIIAGALTHDLGIVEVQDKLHQQKTALTDQQWQQIRQHPYQSWQKLVELGVNDKIWLDIAQQHHERLDGTGYPDGLSDKQLPLGVRIMAVADIYTALIRPTVFRSENSGKSALTVLYKERGATLDARLVDVLIKEIGVYPIGSLVRLSNQEIAVVIKCGEIKSKPVVSALLSPDGQIYPSSKLRQTAEIQFKIVKELSLAKNRFLHTNIENEWSSSVL